MLVIRDGVMIRIDKVNMATLCRTQQWKVIGGPAGGGGEERGDDDEMTGDLHIAKCRCQRTCSINETGRAEIGAVVPRFVRQDIDSPDQRRSKSIDVGRLLDFAVGLGRIGPIWAIRGGERPQSLRARHISPDDDLESVFGRLGVEDGVDIHRHPLQQRRVAQ